MQLLFLGLALYVVTSSKPSSSTTAPPVTPKAAPPGSNFASDLGAFVAGFLAEAESKFGKDDSP